MNSLITLYAKIYTEGTLPRDFCHFLTPIIGSKRIGKNNFHKICVLTTMLTLTHFRVVNGFSLNLNRSYQRIEVSKERYIGEVKERTGFS